MRLVGIAKDGEFSLENLAFKVLRNSGYMKKLYDFDTQSGDKELSLD